jgi:hypothetical protein
MGHWPEAKVTGQFYRLVAAPSEAVIWPKGQGSEGARFRRGKVPPRPFGDCSAYRYSFMMNVPITLMYAE